ncbi:trypsin-like peptidase domain-containing protein [Streptomyces sp. NPDC048737]|uniref:S1C family serine protease n=1 Tax=unclassified Streptomyces TaxID=2593676 RepID=UPI0034305079
MNEGKPTESPAGRANGNDPSATAGHPAGDEPVEGGPVEGSPAGRTGGESPSGPARGVISEGDYQLARPAQDAEKAVADRPRPFPDGDVTPDHRPAAHPVAIEGPERVTSGADTAPTPAGGATGSATPAGGATGFVTPAGGPARPAEPTPQPPAVTDRPKPLHDPDPYGTPPYGEPGPWAPAPPVQHPAATPAPGTAAVDATVPPPAAPAPASGPLVSGPSASGPLVSGPPVPGTPTADSSTPGVPGTGAFVTPPAVPGVPGTAVGVPHAPSPDSVPGVPGAPASDTVPPAPVSAPVAPQPVPGAPGVPATAPEAHSRPAPTATAPVDPWRRYDPWAGGPVAAGPLQQTGAAVAGREQLRRRRRRSLAGGALLLALLSGGIGGGVGVYLERNGGMGAVELPQAPVEAGGRDADGVAGIAARALPGVVTLHVGGSEAGATGTGFVLDTRGHILTNSHVVEPAGSGGGISVVFNGGRTAEAEVVGKDSGYDLAVVKVTGVRGLKPLPLGNSDNVRVGDPVVAIGAPFDLEGTVTSGIISAKERPITAGGESGDASDVSYVDALQTDAPINPGNSGGPLLDARGQVVGINSAIRSAADGTAPDGGQAGSIGLGFAIPVNQGKRVAEELINTGRATHPVIGVTLDMDYSGDGARVGTEDGGGSDPVTAGGPGDRAGIRPGDVITAVDGRPVHSGEELIVKIRAHRPGDRLELTVERDGEERTLPLVLGSSDSG